MKRISKHAVSYTAIILCILTLLTALCPMVQTIGKDARGTRFFAVPFSISMKSEVPPAITVPSKTVVISWIKDKDFILSEDNSVFCRFVKGFSDLYIPKGIKSDKQSSVCNTEKLICNRAYYLRI